MKESAIENYKKVFNTNLKFGKSPALILIDFVEAYFNEKSPLYANVDNTLKSAVKVREAARKALVPVIYTRVVYQPSMADAGRFYEKIQALEAFKEGSNLGKWMKCLSPEANELIITKQYPSAVTLTHTKPTYLTCRLNMLK